MENCQKVICEVSKIKKSHTNKEIIDIVGYKVAVEGNSSRVTEAVINEVEQ